MTNQPRIWPDDGRRAKCDLGGPSFADRVIVEMAGGKTAETKAT